MPRSSSSPSLIQSLKLPAQILAITTSALFAGYTVALSVITVPMMLEHFGSARGAASATPSPPPPPSSTTTTAPNATDRTTESSTQFNSATAAANGNTLLDSANMDASRDSVSAGSGSSRRKSALNEALLLSQWRQMYVHGARTSRPATAVPVVCYLFLMYTVVQEISAKAKVSRTSAVSTGVAGMGQEKDMVVDMVMGPDRGQAREMTGGRQLGFVLLWYMVALGGQCGIVLALTALRRTNGALGRRCEKILAPPPPELQDIALRYASHETRSIEREANITWTSERLVRRWKWHNDVRSVLLIIGVVAGLYAIVLDSRE